MTDELRAAIARAYPHEDWHNQCAGLAYLVCRLTGEVVQPYGSATDAARASHIESSDADRCPPGGFHFWSYVTTIGGHRADYGHVAVSLGGAVALMTDPEDHEATWGRELGVTNVHTWTRNRAGIVTYLGWSRTYGRNRATIAAPAVAGGKATPLTPTPADQAEEEGNPMADKFIVTDRDRAGKPISDKQRRGARVNTVSGFNSTISHLTLADADRHATENRGDATAIRMSEAQFDNYIADLERVRTGVS
jgi:hypothetical protein